MLTSLELKNFKRFGSAEIELGQSVVLIGPNNSGKTTALQALALWEIGLRQWHAKRGGKASPEKRPGVTINRRDIVSIPIPSAELLWRDLHVREGERVKPKGGDREKTVTRNIRIDITVAGVTDQEVWKCGFEFDYSNEESFICRPLRLPGFEDTAVSKSRFSLIPDAALSVRVAYLPPMSGLSDREFIKQQGEIGFLIGQGQTAQVLRNLCYRVHSGNGPSNGGTAAWQDIAGRIKSLFGVELRPPKLVGDRSEIVMEYKERGAVLDLSSSGRGLQQTLLLLAHLYANPGTVLLLDEPDAHLEILRQRQTYNFLTEVAQRQNSQIIAASHSEVVLNEAADHDIVIDFVGHPHRIDDRGHQTAKALKQIGFDQYYLAEQTGWVLYLEGSTDLSILRTFAQSLNHDAFSFLESPFLRTVGNTPSEVRTHFFGLREAKRDLVGVAIFDRLDRPLPADLGARGLTWRRREIENYLCHPEVLLAFANDPPDLFSQSRKQIMDELIRDLVPPVALRDESNQWWVNTKATDDFLDPLFAEYFKRQGLPNLMRKTDYHELARFIRPERLDPEVIEKLDAVLEVARMAKP